MAAPEGNRNGYRGARWRDALHRALTRYEALDGSVKAGEALNKLAENVVSKAIQGDWNSIQEVANRLDGKAAQALTIAGDPDAPLNTKHTVTFVGGSPATEQT